MRNVVALALYSHIPVQTWLDDPDPRVLMTAFDLIAEDQRDARR